MKGRVLVVHEEQDRDLENGDQRRKNTVFKKGNTSGIYEDRRRDKDKDKDEVEVEVEMRAR